MTGEERRKIIFDTVDDLAKNFVFYDRKEDEELSTDDILEAIEEGNVSFEGIVSRFRSALEEELKRYSA